MLPNKRKTHKFRRRFLWYFLFLLLLGASVVLYYFFNLFDRSLYISPFLKVESQRLDLETKLKNARISFSSIDFDSDYSYLIILSQGEKIRFSSRKNIDQQISSLQRILRELTIKGKIFKSIDFRFENPFVEFI